MSTSRQNKDREKNKATVICKSVSKGKDVSERNGIHHSTNHLENNAAHKSTHVNPHDLKNTHVYELIQFIQDEPEDEKSKEKLVLQYEGLVHSLAGKYSRMQENHEDLVQVGLIGLLIAAKRFNPDYGKTFEAFAIPTIIGEIKRFIRDKTWGVHVPRRIKELGPKINRAIDELTNTMEVPPKVKDIANYLEVSEEDVLETMEMTKSYRALSMDYTHETGNDGSTFTLMDLVGKNEPRYEKTDLQLVLESVFPTLPEREQEILRLIFFDNLSQQEVGKVLGMSQMHVSRLQRRALRKLREVLGPDNFNMFQ